MFFIGTSRFVKEKIQLRHGDGCVRPYSSDEKIERQTLDKKNAGVPATRTPADSHFPERDYGLTKIPFSLR